MEELYGIVKSSSRPTSASWTLVLTLFVKLILVDKTEFLFKISIIKLFVKYAVNFFENFCLKKNKFKCDKNVEIKYTK